MSRWLTTALHRIHRLARQHRVQLTRNAWYEMADIGMSLTDAAELLCSLDRERFKCRQWSSLTEEWLYVFLVAQAGVSRYLKVLIRDQCVVVSLHEDESTEDLESQDAEGE